jgi:hypothetical protein
MLHLYISHAPADKRYVAEFMEWIAPLQVRYNLRIWYDHPEPDPVVPYPWNILFFWYSPRSSKRPYHRKMHEELDQGHIFLFFTSQKSIATPWIENIEIPGAVDRYQQLGSKYVRIYPVLVETSQWKIHSRLAGFSTLGPVGKTVGQVKPREDAWFKLVEDLRKVIVELRQNHLDLHQQKALPMDAFDPAPAPWNDAPERVIPFPNWAGWLIMSGIVYLAITWLVAQIKPTHKPYWPKKEMPKQEQPYLPKQVPQIPVRQDTFTPSGGRIRDAR